MRTEHVRGILPAHEMIPFDSEEFPNRGSICGVASLRGRDLPVIDLRGKMGIAHGTHGRQPCVIVVEVGIDSAPRLFGFVADRISEVLRLRDRDFKNGSARVNGRARRILDPESIFSDQELANSLSSTPLDAEKQTVGPLPSVAAR
jgi:chemotaxis signal transduction protein